MERVRDIEIVADEMEEFDAWACLFPVALEYEMPAAGTEIPESELIEF